MKKRLLILILLSIFIFSCEDPFCIIPVEPELPNKEFPIGSTENYYYVDLTAEINNEPRDDDYRYFFDVRGLPEGMNFFVNYRTISLEGTPEETGIFKITIFLDVDGPFGNFNNDPNTLCNFSTSKTYTLIIEEN
ncbi:hypothetical protein [Winogradskyella sp.]|uniref:hypothetical protein n=1 Tax=Winogradskyella sp. TaxID=1883156 RepID=UPI002635CCEE|nr:hypothetical protein [Winogradskyella sp.]